MVFVISGSMVEGESRARRSQALARTFMTGHASNDFPPNSPAYRHATWSGRELGTETPSYRSRVDP